MENLIVYNSKEYEVEKLNSVVTNKTKTISVILIGMGGYITVGEGFRIYNGRSGKPILKSRFENISEAIQFAEWLYKAYKDYLVIWEDYPEANIIQWCRYTVVGGMELWRIMEMLGDKEKINNLDISRAWSIAKEELKKDERAM